MLRPGSLLWLTLALAVAAAAQVGSNWLDWLSRLQALEAAAWRMAPDAPAGSLADLDGRAAAVANEMRAWSDSRPGIAVPLPDFSAPAANREAFMARVGALREAAEEIAGRSPNNPFDLGRVEVNVRATPAQTPLAAIVGQEEMRERNVRVAPQALNLVPGVNIQRIGPRNETGVFVRGFDVRQVPLYIDGVPVYVPYDGYVDLDRFTTFDLAEVQVAKGYTSPLYGPNAIGGAINLVTKAPTDPLHLDLGAGLGSGRERNGYANVGARLGRAWFQGGFSALDARSVPLSGDFRPTATQPGFEREDSWRRDVVVQGKAAWNPRDGDQYVFAIREQRGQKGNPPYAGLDPAVQVRYWQWPKWDKRGFTFSANKGLGETSYLRARLYYDKFDNMLLSFDDAAYATQTRPFAFSSPFDDDTYGGILELGTGAIDRHTLKTSFYFKDDTHREGNLGTPTRSFRDQSTSWGIEDTIALGRRATLIAGFSADHLNVKNAQQFVNNQVLPVETNALWAVNPTAALLYSVGNSGRLRVSAARKTRLPTIKDRYSFRMGLAVPNPQLDREAANNYEVGYGWSVGGRTMFEAALFRSDIQDFVQAVFLQPNLFQLQNVGQAVDQGGEFSLRSQLTGALNLHAQYTYLKRDIRSGASVIAIDTPRHKSYGALIWRPVARLMLLGEARHEAGRFSNNPAGRVFPAPAFADFGIGATADAGRGVQLQAGLHNLLDRNYFFVEGYPEPGRMGYLNLRYRF